MDQKLITFAVPCYNSAAYMRHCIETLLSAGERAEIILVDDGSVKDETPAICDEYAAKYPAIVKAIWGDTDCGSTKKLQVNMANIRRKLGSRPGKNTYILNELGVGYRMIDEDRDSHTEEDA